MAFKVDAHSLQLLRDEVGIGRIVELPPADAGMLARYIPTHLETIYVAASGVGIGNDYGHFRHGETLLAIEWIRHETNPKPNEPECNVYRYVFGPSKDGHMIGLDVTTPHSNPITSQVGEHWSDFEDVFRRHF